MASSVNNLATLYRLGLATAAQAEALAAETIRIAQISCRVACRQQRLRQADMDDVVQIIAIKALGLADRWDLQRASWRTYVSVIARSAIGDQGRKYQKENKLYQAMAEQQAAQDNTRLKSP
jgi:DNA-directed RNA polymerase specialized sigma24 family protein